MKKSILITLVALLLVVAGCNEKNLLDNIEGSWGVKTYLYSNTDRTGEFKNTKLDFIWTFSGNKDYSESWKEVDSTYYELAVPITVPDVSGNDSIVGYDTVPAYEIDTFTFSRSGTWTLINSNKFLQLKDTVSRDYRIMDHSKDCLRLFKGNEEFLLEPK